MSNVGYATLQVMPSLKNLHRHLTREATPALNKWAKEAGAAIGDTIAAETSAGLSRSISDAIREGGEDGAARVTIVVADQAAEGARRGVRDGLADGAEEGTRRMRTRLLGAVRDAMRGGFRLGFREMFAGSQSQGDRMRRSLGLGIAAGFIEGGRDGFRALSAGVRSFISNANDALAGMAKTALAGVTTVLQGAGTTVATGGLNLLLGALLAVAAAIPIVATGFVALAPAVLLAGGLFGSFFTVLAGGTASIGVTTLAFRGLGDAFSEVMEKGKATDETLKRLSPNARKFVKAFQGLRKPLSDLRKFVQDKVFAGLDATLKRFATRWLPALKPMLGDLGTRFNRFGKTVLNALSRPEFIKNTQAAVKGFGDFLDRLGKGLDPLIGAFGKLAKASVPFLAALGDGLGRTFEKFAAWIAQAEKSGALAQFMKDAAQALKDIWAIGGLVIGIGKELINTFFPSSKKASDSFLGGVRGALKSVRDWLANPENKQKIQEFMDKLGELISKIQNEWIPRIAGWAGKVDEWVRKVEGWGATLSAWKDRVTGIFNAVAAVVGLKIAAIRGFLNSIEITAARVIAFFLRMRAGAMAQLDRLVSAARDIPRRILGALAGLPGQMFSIGASIVSGMVRGMLSRVGNISAAGSQLGAAAMNAARRALDINSPSRVFMEIGRYTADGMALGITQGTGRVTKAVADMTAAPEAPASRTTGGTTAAAGGPLIGNLTLAPSRESARDQLEEVTFALRRIRRGGVYA
ncbi:hypothetical protein [Micromonospora sp. KC213]|uniref:phage tail protein n=1 Tax=Micromonospora sp. KC213 TaxID=2530378 RepID=UPI00104C04E6|nr:hypothetical protein [Micromonospora sp. KC213]TDC33462.1 hypothetical protein E1166_25675 [Micromonospora sp. KC213]